MAMPSLRRPPVDLIDQSIYEAGGPPHALFKQLRTESPVCWNAMGDDGFWSILRYQDVFDVSLDTKTFSAARAGVILRDHKPEEYEVQKGLLVNLDPPQHTKHRRLVSIGFSGKVIRNIEGHVRDVTREILDDVAPLGRCDFVDRVSAELPLQVIVEMVGVPKEDRRKVLEWTNKMIAFDDPEYGGAAPEVGQMAAAELFMYANELAEDREKNPKDDLVSILMQAEVDGERLSRADFSSFFMLLLVAGNETTRNLISGGMLTLIEHPEQRARLMADRSLLPSAIEEMLRWVSPVNVFRRTATRDTEIGGQQIREGEKVALFYASANRDEAAFENPEIFDIARTPNDHLAFGIGPHFCLGANLARLEIRVMFEELLRRMPDIELDGPAERLRSYFINGIKRMPVRFTASSASA
jgi:cholest-4-en-3-one 26-monooxygenase